MQVALSSLILLAEYREQRQHIFPSPASLDWFIRCHKAGLVTAGAILMLTGRWLAAPERFDAYLLTVGTQAARSHIQPQAPSSQDPEL